MPSLPWIASVPQDPSQSNYWTAQTPQGFCRIDFDNRRIRWVVRVGHTDIVESFIDDSSESLSEARERAEALLVSLAETRADGMLVGTRNIGRQWGLVEERPRSRFDLIDEDEPIPPPRGGGARAAESVAPRAEIVPGSVVVLKSEGPTMTVSSREGDQVRCMWFVAGHVTEYNFPVHTLELKEEHAEEQDRLIPHTWGAQFDADPNEDEY